METRKKKIVLFTVAGLFLTSAVTLSVLLWLGSCQYVGPFAALSISMIQRQNPVAEHQNEIVFYGASNFRLWTKMKEDMAAYGYHHVGNHAFGGAQDEDLLTYAPSILYPYHPSVVFLQTGSNDYAYSGLSQETVETNKKSFYADIRANLPEVPVMVMSGLPLPGREEYRLSIDAVNHFLKDYCQANENFYFLDADPIMLNSDGSYKTEYFGSDQIHLNQAGHDAWTKLMVAGLISIGMTQN